MFTDPDFINLIEQHLEAMFKAENEYCGGGSPDFYNYAEWEKHYNSLRELMGQDKSFAT